MKSFKVGKNVFIVSYLILGIITVILIISTFSMLTEYGSNSFFTRELQVLTGFLFFYAVVCLFEVMYGLGIQQDESKGVLKTLIIAFLLNVFTIFAVFEYADMSVLHGSNLGFVMYKTYNYFFISLNLVGFGANLYLIFNRFS
ncbi:hypothetical protein LCGC14_2978060 [marine sediment metagenome]|uniref:Uncharacterized protein n=1 Tax=marine sediment metagenome TaxID=412755 RepID=A0A0F8ZEZ1_9ZZZZ